MMAIGQKGCMPTAHTSPKWEHNAAEKFGGEGHCGYLIPSIR